MFIAFLFRMAQYTSVTYSQSLSIFNLYNMPFECMYTLISYEINGNSKLSTSNQVSAFPSIHMNLAHIAANEGSVQSWSHVGFINSASKPRLYELSFMLGQSFDSHEFDAFPFLRSPSICIILVFSAPARCNQLFSSSNVITVHRVTKAQTQK